MKCFGPDLKRKEVTEELYDPEVKKLEHKAKSNSGSTPHKLEETAEKMVKLGSIRSLEKNELTTTTSTGKSP